MTTKEYKLIANTINEVRKLTNINQNSIDWVMDRLIHNFRKMDKNFNEREFEDICNFQMQEDY